MMTKQITMKVLMETMKKLQQEVDYDKVVPGGKSKPKNFSMSTADLAAKAAHVDRKTEDPLDTMYADAEKERVANEPTRPMRKVPSLGSDDDFSKEFPMVGEAGVIEDPDTNPFSSTEPTQTSLDIGDLGDTEIDSASTTELVDRLSDAVVDTLKSAMPLDLSSEEGKATVQDALLSVLQDMDATDLYDRS